MTPYETARRNHSIKKQQFSISKTKKEQNLNSLILKDRKKSKQVGGVR